MNFAWAMDMVLNQERAVRRESWLSKQYIIKDSVGVRIYPQIYKNEDYKFEPSQRDYLSEDWVEVLEV